MFVLLSTSIFMFLYISITYNMSCVFAYLYAQIALVQTMFEIFNQSKATH